MTEGKRKKTHSRTSVVPTSIIQNSVNTIVSPKLAIMLLFELTLICLFCVINLLGNVSVLYLTLTTHLDYRDLHCNASHKIP